MFIKLFNDFLIHFYILYNFLYISIYFNIYYIFLYTSCQTQRNAEIDGSSLLFPIRKLLLKSV